MFFKKIIFLTLTIFCTSSLFASLEELRQTFRIENDVLISADTKQYHPYPFIDSFHSDLAYTLKDLNQAQLIHNAYKKHLASLETKEAEATLQKAILEICLLFGNPTNSPQKALFSALSCQGIEGEKWIQEHELEISAFIQEANQPIYPQIIPHQNDDYTIAVITTSCSGGNLSISNGIIEFLRTQKGIKVVEIDTEEVAKLADPIKIATQSLTYDGIYSAIFQQTNDFSIIQERKQLRRDIHRYIPSDFLAALKQTVRNANPNLIISIRSYTPEDIALSTLGVPFRMMHVDFELCSSLDCYYRSVPTNSIRFWLHHCEASMFKPLFQTYGHLDQYNPKDTIEEIAKKITLFLPITPEEFLQQFEVIGYPASSIFHPIKEEEILNQLKEKWSVKQEEIPIFIMMGKHSTAASKEIFDTLLDSPTRLPFKYLFICGKNQELKQECEKILALHPSSTSERFHILGLMTPEQINEIMNISAFGISKSGASSAIEIMATQTHALLTHSYPWEQINGKHLSDMGYAVEYDHQKNLIVQIEECLQIFSKKLICNNVAEWQNRLLQCIEELKLLEEHQQG